MSEQNKHVRFVGISNFSVHSAEFSNSCMPCYDGNDDVAGCNGKLITSLITLSNSDAHVHSAFWKHSGEHQKGREWFLKGESRGDECAKVIDAEEDRSERIGNSWKSRKRRIASEYEVHPRHLAHAYAATSFGIQWIVKFVYLYNGCAIVKLARPPIKFIEFWCMHALSYTRFGAMHSQSTEYSALKTVKCSMNRFIVHVSWLCVLSWLSQR